MLTPEQLAPFLGHDDRFVRRQARDYFRHCADFGSVTADACWDAIDRLGERDNGALRWDTSLAVLEDLPQTDASVRRLVDALNERPVARSAGYLQRAAQRIDQAIVARNRDLLLGCDQFDDATLAVLQRRLDLADVTPDAAWDQLMAYCASIDDKYFDELDLGQADTLVEAVARHIDSLGPRAVALLSDVSIDDYREHFLIQAVGRARYAPATDVLFAKMEIVEADLLPDIAGEALARIGTDDIIARLATYKSHPDWGTRLSAGGALAHIKSEAAEDALLGFTRDEDDDDLRGFQVESLCDMASLAGLDVGRGLIVADPKHPEMISLSESLLAVATMLGIALPEEPHWRARIEKYEAELARQEQQMEGEGLAAFANRMRQMSPDFADGPDDVDPFDDPLPPRPMPGEYDPYARIEPIRNEQPKVGRNDPCPCGSGKKHKKCCGAPK